MAVRYNIEALFCYIPIASPFFKFFSFFVSKKENLPAEIDQRVMSAYREADYVFQTYARFAAIYPDFLGTRLSYNLLMTRRPDFDFTQDEFQEIVDMDFPHCDKSFFNDSVPAAVWTRTNILDFKRALSFLTWIFNHSVCKSWNEDACEHLEMFKKFVVFCDMRRDAGNLEQMKHNFARNEEVFFPEIDWLRTSAHVLTYFPYEKRPFQPTQNTARLLAGLAIDMILRDGLFTVFNETHLENTPDGKLIVKAGPYIVKLSPREHQALLCLVYAISRADYEKAVAVLVNAGFLRLTMPIETLADRLEKVLRANVQEPLSRKCALLIEYLGQNGLTLSAEMRLIYPCLLSVERVGGDQQIWTKMGHEVSVYLTEFPKVSAEGTKDVVRELRARFLTLPEMTDGLINHGRFKKPSFVKNPKLIAKILSRKKKD